MNNDIIATHAYAAPMHWKTALIQKLSLASAVSGLFAAVWEHEAGYIMMGGMPALLGLLHVLKHSDDAKQQEKTDADVHAVVGANAIQCTPCWGIHPKMIVLIRGTRPPEHETEIWSQKAAQELHAQLQRGFCEISEPQPTDVANVYTAHISVRLPYPDKNGQHKHIDLAHHLLRNGLLVIDRSESVPQSYERCVMEAKRKGKGVWRYLQ